MYKIFLKRSAQKDLSKLSKKILITIISEIENLKHFPKLQNVKKLINRNNQYRLKVKYYRILFFIEHENKLSNPAALQLTKALKTFDGIAGKV